MRYLALSMLAIALFGCTSGEEKSTETNRIEFSDDDELFYMSPIDNSSNSGTAHYTVDACSFLGDANNVAIAQVIETSRYESCLNGTPQEMAPHGLLKVDILKNIYGASSDSELHIKFGGPQKGDLILVHFNSTPEGGFVRGFNFINADGSFDSSRFEEGGVRTTYNLPNTVGALALAIQSVKEGDPEETCPGDEFIRSDDWFQFGFMPPVTNCNPTTSPDIHPDPIDNDDI